MHQHTVAVAAHGAKPIGGITRIEPSAHSTTPGICTAIITTNTRCSAATTTNSRASGRTNTTGTAISTGAIGTAIPAHWHDGTHRAPPCIHRWVATKQRRGTHTPSHARPHHPRRGARSTGRPRSPRRVHHLARRSRLRGCPISPVTHLKAHRRHTGRGSHRRLQGLSLSISSKLHIFFLTPK